MKHRDYRWLIVFGGNLLLYWLVGLVNHHLAPHALHLYVGGLFVTYAGLRLDLKHGFISTLLTGLLIDATAPVRFGTSLALFGLVQATLFYGRRRFPREEPVFAIVVALLANLFLFIVLSFLLVGDNPRPGQAWLRLFADLVASQLALGLVTPWFMAFQSRLLDLAQIHPETGRRVMT
jgi:rod shape-determining protein MreD